MTTLASFKSAQQSMPGSAAPTLPENDNLRQLSVLIYLNDLSGGGAERQCLTLARELMAQGVGVELILHRLRGELTDQVPAGMRVINMDRRRTRHDVRPLAQYVRQSQPDILLANVDHMNIVATLAGMLSFAPTKVVITQHNALAGKAATDGWHYHFVAPIYRALSPFISAAVAVSDGIARELVSTCGVPARKVVRIYNAVIDPEFSARADQPVMHPWFCDGRGPVFITAARLTPQKDQSTLLQAMALHVRNGGRGRLLILGTGPSRGSLEALVHDLQIADAVDFVGFQSNPLPWFRHADLFVLTSRAEGFGIALAEAMGCGTPAVSTDSHHGPAEILGQGRYGVLIPPQNPPALAAVLDDAAAIRRRYPPDMLKARAADFSNAACTNGYLSLFQRLVRESSAAAGASVA
ncbi:MAG TPA: glycosyltransferase [Acetobacteraceae bacterium]|jgi:glycosyltransferase involved in cell wall biosynthesis|nr:glycosyltransferase [Acetobacteraceae bacterium]